MDKIKLYTNPKARQMLSDMRDSGRIPHSFLITGKQGVGKKVFAKYLTQMILCENPHKAPCGQCNSCRKVNIGEHPDVIYAEHSGKLGGFSAEFMREEIVAKAYIKPNDGDYKVYVFADCNNFQTRTQNTLLKLIEEPPRHAKFIFTATSENVFLPTILSRTTHIELFEATREECVEALKDNGVDDATIANALEVCGNDIGKCFEYINGGGENSENVTAFCGEILSAIAKKNEYLLNVALFKTTSDRNVMLDTLEQTCLSLRDSATISENADTMLLGNDRKNINLLSKSFSSVKLVKMIQILNDCAEGVNKNCSRPLMASSASAKISELF